MVENARARLNEELQFKKTDQWSLPTTPIGFLEWLRSSGVPGDNDNERLAWYFENNASAPLMPPALRDALRSG